MSPSGAAACLGLLAVVYLAALGVWAITERHTPGIRAWLSDRIARGTITKS